MNVIWEDRRKIYVDFHAKHHIFFFHPLLVSCRAQHKFEQLPRRIGSNHVRFVLKPPIHSLGSCTISVSFIGSCNIYPPVNICIIARSKLAYQLMYIYIICLNIHSIYITPLIAYLLWICLYFSTCCNKRIQLLIISFWIV
jgi:hypothetical protein